MSISPCLISFCFKSDAGAGAGLAFFSALFFFEVGDPAAGSLVVLLDSFEGDLGAVAARETAVAFGEPIFGAVAMSRLTAEQVNESSQHAKGDSQLGNFRWH